MYIDTHWFEAILKKIQASSERSDFWRHLPKPHPSSNAPFQHAALLNKIENTY